MSERPQPSPEHVDALARATPWTCAGHLGGWCPIHESSIRDGDEFCRSARDDARAILTSDDPAVHEAMLAALTRAGVLTEETTYVGPETGAWVRLKEPKWRQVTSDEALDILRDRLTSPTRAQDGPQEPVDAPEAPVEPQDADDATEAP